MMKPLMTKKMSTPAAPAVVSQSGGADVPIPGRGTSMA